MMMFATFLALMAMIGPSLQVFPFIPFGDEPKSNGGQWLYVPNAKTMMTLRDALQKKDANAKDIPLSAVKGSVNSNELIEWFREIDANNDGWVTEAEVEGNGKVFIVKFKAHVGALDTDGNGQLSYKEFQNIDWNQFEVKKAGGAEKLKNDRKLFKDFDTNGDGKVTLAEAVGEVQKEVDDVPKIFKQYFPGEGRVNLNEFLALYGL